ncbi:MAG: hypothetical protein F4X41_05335 [Chloroflexi bacterium]|nr:hypothetical protein [Chloroflexota bacterium]
MPGSTAAAPAGGHWERWIDANFEKALAELDPADISKVFGFEASQVDPADLLPACAVILRQERSSRFDCQGARLYL